jgi:hypothetical protein
MNHGIAHVKALVGRSETSTAPAAVPVQATPFEQLPPGAVIRLRDSDLNSFDVQQLIDAVTGAPSLCLYCGECCDPDTRFTHDRWLRDNETVRREQAAGGAR